MGNCWILQAHCTVSCSDIAGGNNQLGSTHIYRNHSESSQNLQARGEYDDVTNHGGLTLDVADLRVFTLAELKKATRDFRANTLLGHGAFSRVYKGRLKERKASSCGDEGLLMVIAIKRLNFNSMQLEEWQSNINLLGRLHHPNLVRLLGFGRDNSELFLVYEFMQEGSLDKHLFGSGFEVQPLAWDIRLKVTMGAARGLAFLHSLETNIIYRDFKPSNILLDKRYNAKLSDLGFAKFGPSSVQAHLPSTHDGYAAPENIATGHVSLKSDVYGFGIVLVEILSGKMITDITKQCGQNQTLLADWLKSNVLMSRMKMRSLLMDARLKGKYPSKLALRVAQLALNCIQTHPKLRPSMQEVADTLQDIEAMNCKRSYHNNNTKRPTYSRAAQIHGPGPWLNHIT